MPAAQYGGLGGGSKGEVQNSDIAILKQRFSEFRKLVEIPLHRTP